MVSYTIKGIREATAQLRKVIENAPDEFGRALMVVAKQEAKECARRAPKDSGTMRDEIHAEGPIRNGRQIKAIVTTGPDSADYALIQHEDLDLFHKYGEAKFIERPLTESAPHMADRVAAEIKLGK